MAAPLLLIEDDASIARFIQLALEDLPLHDPAVPAVSIEVVTTLAGARAALARGGWQLVLSDLMLPDGSAETLLAEGHARVDGAPPWLVLSAGVHDQRREALLASGVARTLRKPVALVELLDAVAGLLRPGAAPAAAVAADTADTDPVQRHFGGDRTLFDTFRTGCLERFADDLAQGQAAQDAGDVAAMRRVAHGLKAVLELIGQPALSAQARALEDCAAAWVPGAPLPDGWPALARGLAALRKAG